MKTILVTVMLLLFLGNVQVHAQVQAEECRTQLKKEDRYDDLTSILKCFDRNIKLLERRINRLEAENNSANKTIEGLRSDLKRLEPSNKTTTQKGQVNINEPKAHDQTFNIH